jgi:arsenate reductase-like glutaredoxin family protein
MAYKRLNVSIDEYTHEQLVQMSRERHQSISQIIRTAVQNDHELALSRAQLEALIDHRASSIVMNALQLMNRSEEA